MFLEKAPSFKPKVNDKVGVVATSAMINFINNDSALYVTTCSHSLYSRLHAKESVSNDNEVTSTLKNFMVMFKVYVVEA